MLDLGLDVLFKGKNMARLLGGLGVALKISAVSVIISLPLGILLGVLMTSRNPVIKAVLRLYLEFVRIMPQMVLLFLVYFGTTRAFGVEPFRRDGIHHRVCAVGHRRNERPCARCADRHSEAPV